VFPYGRNIAGVVSAVMDKDRQGAAQKPQAVVRLHEARPKRQRGLRRLLPPAEASRHWRRSRPSLHPAGRRRLRLPSVVPSLRRLHLRPAGCRRPRRRPESCRRRASASPTSPPTLAWTTILLVSRWLDFFYKLLIRRRVGRRPTCCCSACRVDHGGCRSAKGEGRCS
jgi:hypothetical protein